MSPNDFEPHFLFGPDGPTLWSVYEEMDPSWDLDVCAKCQAIMVSVLSVKVPAGDHIDDPIANLVWCCDRVCPPCSWYLTEFENRLLHWEDSQDWNSSYYFEEHRPNYVNDLSDSLWHSARLQAMREEYHRHVVRLVKLKKAAARTERESMNPISVPRQVPWSWLENTDYGRFRVDNDSVAV